jgi:hypothetical protein
MGSPVAISLNRFCSRLSGENRTFASDSKTVRGEPVEPQFFPMNALRQAQGERMERKSWKKDYDDQRTDHGSEVNRTFAKPVHSSYPRAGIHSLQWLAGFLLARE